MVSSIGIGKEEFWANSVKGKSGISLIDSFDTRDYPSKIASIVRDFSPYDYMDIDFVDRTDRFS